MMAQIKQGAHYVIGSSILSFLFVFAMLLAVSSGILNALFMPLLEGELGLGSAQVGLVLSAGAASGAAAAVYFSRKQKIDQPLYLIVLAELLAGIAIFGLVLAFDLVTAMLSWVIIGAVDVVLIIPLTVLMQELVEDELRGRVFSLLSVTFTALQVVGMAIGGIWAETVAATGPPMTGAALVLVLVSLLGFLVVAKLNLHASLSKPVDEESDISQELVVEVSA
jgi:DHA3 family macrolide efflux protein-like MFS transporter